MRLRLAACFLRTQDAPKRRIMSGILTQEPRMVGHFSQLLYLYFHTDYAIPGKNAKRKQMTWSYKVRKHTGSVININPDSKPTSMASNPWM